MQSCIKSGLKEGDQKVLQKVLRSGQPNG